MSSEIITKNDLKAILDEVFPATYPATLVSATDKQGNTSNVQAVFNGIGTLYSASTNKTIDTAGIDNTPTKGASVTLQKGHAYVIVGQWTFNTGSGTSARNNQIQIYDYTANTSRATQRVFNNNAGFCVLQVSYITDVLTANSEYGVCASSSMTYATASSNNIRAIAII